MRKAKLQHQVMSEINITPLTDVMMVLLIIFMVTTPLIMRSGIDINLPKVKSKTQTDMTKQKIEIFLSLKGEIFINDKPVEINELSNNLKKLLLGTKDRTVVVTADEKIAYGKAVQILDIAKQSGATKLVLSAENTPVHSLVTKKNEGK